MAIIKIITLMFMTMEVSVSIEASDAAPNLSDADRWKYSHLIVTAADEHGMDPLLVTAIMWNESDFRNLAVNKTKDYGVMQVHWQKMGRTEHWLDGLTKKDLMVPEINIPAGVEELAFWMNVCRKRGHSSDDHSWVGHYKWGNVVRSDRYERRIHRRLNKLNRAKPSETYEETPRRRGPSARRTDERRADRQMPRLEAGVSIVAMH